MNTERAASTGYLVSKRRSEMKIKKRPFPCMRPMNWKYLRTL